MNGLLGRGRALFRVFTMSLPSRVCVFVSLIQSFGRLQSTASPQWVQHRGAISLSVAPLCCQQADWSRRAEPPVRGRQSGGTGVWQVSRLFWWCCELIKASVWLVLQWHDNDMNNFLELFAWLNMVCCHSLVAFFLCVGIVWYQSWQIVQYKCVYCVSYISCVVFYCPDQSKKENVTKWVLAYISSVFM